MNKPPPFDRRNWKERPNCRKQIEKFTKQGIPLVDIAVGQHLQGDYCQHFSEGMSIQARKMLWEIYDNGRGSSVNRVNESEKLGGRWQVIFEVLIFEGTGSFTVIQKKVDEEWRKRLEEVTLGRRSYDDLRVTKKYKLLDGSNYSGG